MAAARWYLRDVDEVGARVRVKGSNPAITNRGRMVIGQRVQLVSTIARLELVAMRDAVLEIGERSLINFGCSIVAAERVTIGARSLIGPHCMIMDTAFHELDPERRLQVPPPRPITIGENVWLGARVLVMPGVTIGADAAIGAGSVVTKDVPARTLAAGVPARVVREL